MLFSRVVITLLELFVQSVNGLRCVRQHRFVFTKHLSASVKFRASSDGVGETEQTVEVQSTSRLEQSFDFRTVLPDGFERVLAADGKSLLDPPPRPKTPIRVHSVPHLKRMIQRGFRVRDLDVRGDTRALTSLASPFNGNALPVAKNTVAAESAISCSASTISNSSNSSSSVGTGSIDGGASYADEWADAQWDASDLPLQQPLPHPYHHPAIQALYERKRARLAAKAANSAGAEGKGEGESEGEKMTEGEMNVQGSRTDGKRIAIAVEGGGMRGCVAAGMISAFWYLGLEEEIDVIYGSSAGSLVGAYFITGQMPYFGNEVYYDVLTTAGKEFIDLQSIFHSIGLGIFDLRVDSLVNLFKDRMGRPVLNLNYLLEKTVQTIKPLNWDLFWEKQRTGKMELKVVASGLLSRKAVVMSAKTKNFQSLAELSECMKASMLVPGVTGDVIRLKGSQASGENIVKTWWREYSDSRGPQAGSQAAGTGEAQGRERGSRRKGGSSSSSSSRGRITLGSEPLADALIFEPIPYRSAIRENCTHVIVLRTKPDNLTVTAETSFIEKAIMSRFFARHQGMPELAEWMNKLYNKLVYAEDVLVLNEASRDFDPTPNPDKNNGAKMFSVALEPGTPEVSQLETSRRVIFEGVRQGFAAAYDCLANPDLQDPAEGVRERQQGAAGLSQRRKTGMEVAREIWSDSILAQPPKHLPLSPDQLHKQDPVPLFTSAQRKHENDEQHVDEDSYGTAHKVREEEDRGKRRGGGNGSAPLQSDEAVERALSEFDPAVQQKLSPSKRRALAARLKGLYRVFTSAPRSIIQKAKKSRRKYENTMGSDEGKEKDPREEQREMEGGGGGEKGVECSSSIVDSVGTGPTTADDNAEQNGEEEKELDTDEEVEQVVQLAREETGHGSSDAAEYLATEDVTL